MTTPTLSRHETVTRFLAVLAGPSGTGELIELRYRLEDGVHMGQLFEYRSHLRGLATRAVVLGRRTDVYFGCAPRTRRHGGRDAIEHSHVLWADCDGDDAVDALRSFDPVPSIVIASGIIRSERRRSACSCGSGCRRHVISEADRVPLGEGRGWH